MTADHELYAVAFQQSHYTVPNLGTDHISDVMPGGIRRMVKIDDLPEFPGSGKVLIHPVQHSVCRIGRQKVRIERGEVRVAPIERVIAAAVILGYAAIGNGVKG